MSHLARRTAVLAALVALACLALPQPALAQGQGEGTTYRVTIANLTYGQTLSPPVAAVTDAEVVFFRRGEEASDRLRLVAEEGDTSGFMATLDGSPKVLDFHIGTEPIPPGGSATFDLHSNGHYIWLSVVSMLVTTNDAFAGADRIQLDRRNWLIRELVPAWDAGTEDNNEECAFIPGPPCMNPGVRDTEGAEGFVHVHRGIFGIADLVPMMHGWHNPVAEIQIRRLP